ncbi:MAG: tetratricopeptide repeat protein [Pirellulales bacterium]|nr:tetratricopeptide repeat protein [Pirellulales bacterium]
MMFKEPPWSSICWLACAACLSTAGCSEQQQQARSAFQRGQAAMEAEDYETAVREFSVTLEHRPTDVEALEARADCWESLHDYAKAVEDWSMMIRSDRESTELARRYARRGAAYYREHRYDDAIRDYNNSLYLDDQQADIWESRADACRDAGRLGEALYSIQRAIDLKPQESHLRFRMRARIYESLGRNDEALSDYYRALDTTPDDYRAYILCGWLEHRLGHRDAATQVFERLREHAGDLPWVISELADYYHAIGDDIEAITLITHAIAIESGEDGAFNDARYRMQRAEWFVELGMLPEARADYEAVLAMDEDDFAASFRREALLGKSKLLLKLKRPRQAVEAAKAAAALDERDSEAYRCLAAALVASHRLDAARMALDEIIDRTGALVARADRAEIYERLGRPDLALDDADHVLSVVRDPVWYGLDEAYGRARVLRGRILAARGEGDAAQATLAGATQWTSDLEATLETRADAWQQLGNEPAAALDRFRACRFGGLSKPSLDD